MHAQSVSQAQSFVGGMVTRNLYDNNVHMSIYVEDSFNCYVLARQHGGCFLFETKISMIGIHLHWFGVMQF